MLKQKNWRKKIPNIEQEIVNKQGKQIEIDMKMLKKNVQFKVNSIR